VVRPATPSGVNDAVHGPTYVELPCGKVEGVGEWAEPSGFDSAELMLAHFVEERDARAARAANEEQS
jgi:hypothetical protein